MNLTLGRVKVTRNVSQYPLHHVTYVPAKYEVATSNGRGGDAFTIIKRNGRAVAQTATIRLWYEITIAFFFKKKVGIFIVYKKLIV